MVEKTTRELENDANVAKLVAPQAEPWEYEVIYTHVLVVLFIHLSGIYGIYLVWTSTSWKINAFYFAIFILAQLGISAGVHRLWSHKSYKAKIPLQIFLMICFCMNYQNSIVTWVKDHRVHHKYSDTDADPHNPSRGLFFSHFGWTMVRKHPEFRKRLKLMDLSDVYNNPVIMFQKRHNRWLLPLLTLVVPSLIPVYFWGESFITTWHVNMFRYMVNLNIVLTINSIGHKWGYKDYDKAIAPTNNLSIHLITLGEGYHNYHHVFPSDYRSGELGLKINITRCFIEFCAWLGLAYDLKTASEEIIKSRIKRTGHGSN